MAIVNQHNLGVSNFNIKVRQNNKEVNSKANDFKNFYEIFNNQASIDKNRGNNRIQFSKHASMRLGSRNLQLNSEQIRRVEEGINRAKEKGIKDSLVLVDNIALVVNVKSNTVITAIENDKEKIYSNIDGAVIV